MQYIKLRSRCSSVPFLQELLGKIGYASSPSDYLGVEIDTAVKVIQSKSQLVTEGPVSVRPWTLLFDKTKPDAGFGDMFLVEQNVIGFANNYQVELASIKAVNEVESSGNVFFIDGRPKILFGGHVFWKELEAGDIHSEDHAHSSNYYD